ncbi:MAG: hypothetical protein WCQ95_10955 [Bacteroidota bacterium]
MALIINVIFKIVIPFLNLNIKKAIKYKIINIIGASGGHALKLSAKLPFKSSISALCVPHPGHSMPKNALYKQGS